MINRYFIMSFFFIAGFVACSTDNYESHRAKDQEGYDPNKILEANKKLPPDTDQNGGDAQGEDTGGEPVDKRITLVSEFMSSGKRPAEASRMISNQLIEQTITMQAEYENHAQEFFQALTEKNRNLIQTDGVTPLLTEFDLGAECPLDGHSVTVNDMPNTDYTITNDAGFTNCKLVFMTAPEADANITLMYKNRNELVTEFALEVEPHPSTEVVRIVDSNDASQTLNPGEYTITAENKLIIDPPVADGMKVAISYAKKDTYQHTLAYALDIPNEDSIVIDLSAKYQSTGEAIVDFMLEDGKIVFSEGAFMQFALVDVSFRTSNDNQVDLKEDYIENSITAYFLDAENNEIECAEKPGFTIQENKLINLCTAADLSRLRVTYDYAVNKVMSYEFVRLPETAKEVEWQVFIDEQETAAFTSEGKVVTFNEELPANVSIKVLVSYMP